MAVNLRVGGRSRTFGFQSKQRPEAERQAKSPDSPTPFWFSPSSSWTYGNSCAVADAVAMAFKALLSNTASPSSTASTSRRVTPEWHGKNYARQRGSEDSNMDRFKLKTKHVLIGKLQAAWPEIAAAVTRRRAGFASVQPRTSCSISTKGLWIKVLSTGEVGMVSPEVRYGFTGEEVCSAMGSKVCPNSAVILSEQFFCSQSFGPRWSHHHCGFPASDREARGLLLPGHPRQGLAPGKSTLSRPRLRGCPWEAKTTRPSKTAEIQRLARGHPSDPDLVGVRRVTRSRRDKEGGQAP